MVYVGLISGLRRKLLRFIYRGFVRVCAGSFIHKVAKTVGITSKDSKEAEHKEQFTALVREVKGVLNANNCPYLSVSILPHVNSSGKYINIYI